MIVQHIKPIVAHVSNGMILIDTILYNGDFFTRFIDYRSEAKSEILYTLEDDIDQLIEDSPAYLRNGLVSSRRTISSYLMLLDESELTDNHYAVYDFIKASSYKVRVQHIEKQLATIDLDSLPTILKQLEDCHLISKNGYDYYRINERFDNLRKLYRLSQHKK